VNIATGADRAGSPKQITATVPGTGDGSDGTNVAFNPMFHNQRSGLALASNAVYVAFAAYCDARPTHGWLMGFDVTSLASTGVFNTTPNGTLGGIWQAGSAPAVDSAGNVYVTTGNGDFNGTKNFGETLLKLAPRTLTRTNSTSNFFTPSNFATLNAADDDFGSAGPSFLPGTNLIVNGGKEGKVYLLNSSSLGGMVAGDAQIPQSFQAVDSAARPGDTHHIHNHNVVWSSPAGINMYVWGENDYLRAYRFNSATQKFITPATLVGSVLPPPGMPGGTMSLSANGSTAGTGILWATTPSQGNANQASVPAILRAFNAETLALLWDSSSPGDDVLGLSKGSPPLIAKGKVYLASVSGAVSVFGARSGPTPPIANAIYQIRTRTTTGKCADIFNSSTADGGNLQQFTCNGTNAQRFQFINIANDIYEIRNVNSNKCLDVDNSGTADGTNIRQWTCNGSNAQRWAVQALGNGQYRLMPQTAANRCLDVSNSGTADGTNIQQWTCNGSAAQTLTLAFDNTGAQPIPNSTFRITTSTTSGQCLDIDNGGGGDGVNLHQWECNGSDAQRFRFRSLGGNLYEVRASVSEKCLDVDNSGTADGTNIHQWECNGTNAQIWSVDSIGNGRYRISPQVAANKCMDVDNSGTTSGTNIHEWTCNGTAAQQFSVIAP
ncbi:MAG TPA: RICIN domain-containing protein, partial [Polyangiaceae bacterium]|nr:RICIN domain-containing protein [Polyangiaceae bacterium]